MNTTEHLELIKAFCLRNLEIAAKRTPGMWEYDSDSDDLDSDGGWLYAPDRPLLSKQESSHANMEFIAACAGAAEAGWRATIAAIEHMEARNFRYMDELVSEILAAYPLSLIKP